MTTKLKPCPFCGEEEEFAIGYSSEDREGVPAWVTCCTCGVQGPWKYVPSEYVTDLVLVATITEWNSRV